ARIHGIDACQRSYPAADIVARGIRIGARNEAPRRRGGGSGGCLGIVTARLVQILTLLLNEWKRRLRRHTRQQPRGSAVGIDKFLVESGVQLRIGKGIVDSPCSTIRPWPTILNVVRDTLVQQSTMDAFHLYSEQGPASCRCRVRGAGCRQSDR